MLSHGSAIAVSSVVVDEQSHVIVPSRGDCDFLYNFKTLSLPLMRMGSEGPSLISCTASHSSTLAVRSWRTFIEVPLIAGAWTSATQLIGILLTELAAPFADGFIRHDHTAFQEELFHIAKAQTEPKV